MFPTGNSAAPQTVNEVMAIVVPTMRQFWEYKRMVDRQSLWLAGQTLSAAPIGMDPDLEANLKTAMAGLAALLDGFDHTFMDRVTGLW